MWPFGGVEKEIRRREADEALERAREEAERRARLETPARYECVHLEEDEEYTLMEPAVVPPAVPVYGPPASLSTMCYGVPMEQIERLHRISNKLGVPPEALLDVLEESVEYLPEFVLEGMRNDTSTND